MASPLSLSASLCLYMKGKYIHIKLGRNFVSMYSSCCETCSIRRTKSQHLNVSRLVLLLPLPKPLKPVLSREWRCSWTWAAPTTSEWLTRLLPTKVRLISNVWKELFITGPHAMLPFLASHDDVIKRKHFPRYWPFERGIHWSPVNSPHNG